MNSALDNVSVSLNFAQGITILLFAIVAGLYIRFLYIKFSLSYSSKISMGNTLLMVTISVASIIAVVKASLALSLGLVGALSVIRFRTAIKEPYNLSFLLLAICLGISIGASQYIFTLLVSIFGGLGILVSYKSSNQGGFSRSIFKEKDIDTLTVSLSSDASLEDFYKSISLFTKYYSIRSIDHSENEPLNIVLNVEFKNANSLSELKDLMVSKYPGSRFSFFSSPNY